MVMLLLMDDAVNTDHGRDDSIDDFFACKDVIHRGRMIT